MDRLIARLGKNIGIVALVIAALVGGYLLRAWIVPKKPAEQPQKAAAEKKPELWICSMHPYYSSDKPGKCKYCPMDLIPAETDDAKSGPRELVMSERAKKLAGVETAPVERRAVATQVRMSGKVSYDETKLSYISAWVPGRIDRLFVDYTGAPVKRGEHLAELYSPDLLSAQEEFIQTARAVRELDRENSRTGVLWETTVSTFEAARKKLRLLGLTEQQVDEIEKTDKASDHVTISAPIGGIVTEKNVKRGQYVQTGTRLYTIADLSKVWVKLDAYESDLIWLERGGQKVTFTTDAFPGRKFDGRIAFVAPVVDTKTRSVEVRATVPNPDGLLKPNMLVRGVVRVDVDAAGRAVNRELAGKWLCTMHPDNVRDAAGKCDTCGMPLVTTESAGYVSGEGRGNPLVIPDTAPLLTGKRAIVYVEVPGADEPTYVGREVTLGPKAGKYYVVLGGLKEGERVVTQGNFQIDSDLQIKGKPSMMAPKGGTPPPVHQHEGATDKKAPAEGSTHKH